MADHRIANGIEQSPSRVRLIVIPRKGAGTAPESPVCAQSASFLRRSGPGSSSFRGILNIQSLNELTPS